MRLPNPRVISATATIARLKNIPRRRRGAILGYVPVGIGGGAAAADSRPNSTGMMEVDMGEDEPERWEDGTGTRIDDILAEAKAAAERRDQLRPQPPPWKVASVLRRTRIRP